MRFHVKTYFLLIQFVITGYITFKFSIKNVLFDEQEHVFYKWGDEGYGYRLTSFKISRTLFKRIVGWIPLSLKEPHAA